MPPHVPFEDEPVSHEERAAINSGIASLEANGGVTMETLLADFGFTTAEFEQLTLEPPT
jgi:hypothetical protein